MTRVWVRELAGWAAAVAIALLTAGVVASTARAELLFRDGDSLVLAMFARSVLAGEPLDWAMSSVLFLPESAAFLALDALLPLDVNGLLAVSAVLNLVALYGAVRLVAGRAAAGRAPVAWSVIAVAVVGALAMTEISASRDSFELASLLLTTTYYSATVVAVVATVGIARRILDRPRPSAGLLVALTVISLLSTLSNPLFAAWAAVPLGILLLVGARRKALRTRMLSMLGALVGGVALGFAARIPFAPWIANTGAGYARPSLWRESLDYYGGLLAERITAPLGLLAAVALITLVVHAVVRSVRATDPGERLVATIAWVMPVVVVVGAIALGTHAARYLQPALFAPVLALVATPRTLASPRLHRLLAAATALVLLIGVVVGVPRLTSAAQAPDADLACVTRWIDQSDRTGAGQFWTVRLPALHLADPSQLVQVDHRLNGYAWLVNRTDFDAETVSFLVEDAQTVSWELPEAAAPDEVVDCGRYRILDFGSDELRLGPAHS